MDSEGLPKSKAQRLEAIPVLPIADAAMPAAPPRSTVNTALLIGVVVLGALFLAAAAAVMLYLAYAGPSEPVDMAETRTDLPAPAIPSAQPLRLVIVNITADGKMIVLGDEVDPDGLTALLRRLSVGGEPPEVELRWDRNGNGEMISRALDACARAGVNTCRTAVMPQREAVPP